MYGTSFGGRPSRQHHYKYSLLSIINITNANFTLYTSENESADLKDFFYKQNNIKDNHLIIKTFDLKNSKYYDDIQKLKTEESMLKLQRCYEIQYNKFFWLKDEILSTQYDSYYWIDAGLSHGGLIPKKFLVNSGNAIAKYYTSNLFNNHMLTNLLNKTQNKVYLIGKDNTGANYWSKSVPTKYYNNYNNAIHIIGGIFGGLRNNILEYTDLFDKNLYQLLQEEDALHFEELIMSLIYVNHSDKFNIDYFQTWHHEDSNIQSLEFLAKNKSFYKILEDLNT